MKRRAAPLPPGPAIALFGVDRIFSENTGVFDLTMEIPTGSIFGMIGPSGSGKTTSMRLMLGLYRPDRGKVRVLGQLPNKFNSRIRERIGYMPQQFVLYPNLTVIENLRFVASLYGMVYFKRRKRLDEMLELVELNDARNRLGSQLSGGMKRRLELACALVHDPQLLFMDEPTAGIDPVLRGKFWDFFRAFRDQGRTLFVTTQYVGEATYCDLVGVMRDGRLVTVDTPDGLRRRALGGEIVRLVVPHTQAEEALRIVSAGEIVERVTQPHTQPGHLLIYVHDAATALPVIINLFDSHPQIIIKQAEEYRPSFDDVFIMLMEQMENSNV
jgi:ABC-2 type transport system ATP-binding protein